jgi:hypothetical protein
MTRKPAHNSRLPQVAVKCKIESLLFDSASVQVYSLVLLYRHLRQAANRYNAAFLILSNYDFLYFRTT